MSAETGVGPAMASPSHACSGNWADLPQAATSRKNPITVADAAGIDSTWEETTEKDTEWKEATIAIMAISIPMSPTRFMTNAFLAATA